MGCQELLLCSPEGNGRKTVYIEELSVKGCYNFYCEGRQHGKYFSTGKLINEDPQRPHVLTLVSASSNYKKGRSHAWHLGLGSLNAGPRVQTKQCMRSKRESGSSGRDLAYVTSGSLSIQKRFPPLELANAISRNLGKSS